MRPAFLTLLALLLASRPAIGQVRFEDAHIVVQKELSLQSRPRTTVVAFALQDSGRSLEVAARAVAARAHGLTTALARLGLRGDAVRVGEAAHLHGSRVEMRFPKSLREVGTPGTKSFGYRIAVDTVYVVNEAVTVRLSPGTSLLPVVAEARRAGARWVSSPQAEGGWGRDDRLEAAARAALNKARMAADAEARASGGRLGRLISMRRDTSRPPRDELRFTRIDSLSSAWFASARRRVPVFLAVHARWQFVGTGGDAAEQLARREVIGILQGSGSDPRMPETRIARVARALVATRRAYPRLADIRHTASRMMWVAIHDSAARTVGRRAVRASVVHDPEEAYTPVRSVGVPAIDDLSRSFGVTGIALRYVEHHAFLRLFFPTGAPIDLVALSERYARIPQVEFAAADQMLWNDNDNDDWVRVLDKGAHVLLVFTRGGGDCPAGCTEWDHYYVDFDTLSGRATLEREQLHRSAESRRRDPISLWDTPATYATSPYRSLAEVLRGSRDLRWWHRRHAVRVLTLILGPNDEAWRETRDTSPEPFRTLRAQALADRRAAYERLIELLVDDDADVARAAHAALRQLTKKPLPGGREGVPRWRAWLQSQPAPRARATAPAAPAPAPPRPAPRSRPSALAR